MEIIDIDKFVKVNDCKPITDPVFFNGPTPSPEGLLSNEIFGITKAERSGIYAYIDLGGTFLNPLMYKALTRLNSKIADIVMGTDTFNINDSGSDYTMTTGGSNSIGNASSPSTNNDTWMSYRGIENWYASMFKFIDGVNVQERKYFINSNPATFADDVFTGGYVDSGITSVATNGYVSNLVPNKKGFVASAVAGSDATFVPDYFYQTSGNRVVSFGGDAGSGLACGAFFLDASNAASYATARIGSGVSF
jgi:hypothetical protein